MAIDRTRPRAVFSANDFALLKEAVGDYARRLPEADQRVSRLAQLHHRLGRVT